MMPSALIISETVQDRPAQSIEDLVRSANLLASGGLTDIVVVITGRNIQALATDVAAATGFDVIALEDNRLFLPNPELLSMGLGAIINESNPIYICLAHTPRGCQAAAFLSHALQIPCFTGVESLTCQDDDPLLTRSIFNGKFQMNISGPNDRAVLTLTNGASESAGHDREEIKTPGTVTNRSLDEASVGFEPLEITFVGDSDSSLEDADVIISVGAGIEAVENVELAEQLSACFKNAAVGGSRIACDRGWLSHAKQIGETGKKVAPTLYMACGISGSAQHIAGMKDSQMIIAINKDPNAAIFAIADYGVIENLITFLPILIEKIKSG